MEMDDDNYSDQDQFEDQKQQQDSPQIIPNENEEESPQRPNQQAQNDTYNDVNQMI